MTTATITAPRKTAPQHSESAAPASHTWLPPTRPDQGHLSLSDARSLVEYEDRGKWDVTVPCRDLVFKNGELEFAADSGRLAPSTLALGQICTRLGLPSAYIRQCPPVLQDQNLNFWLKDFFGTTREGVTPGQEEKGQEWKNLEWKGAKWVTPKEVKRHSEKRKHSEKWLLRARHGTLRAALSERFSPLDNRKLLETLAPLLPPHYKVQWLGLEDESFHLRIIDPTRAREVLPGDDFFVGVHLANSEVGSRSLTLDAMVYRLVCSNGLVALVKGKSLLRQRHIHVAPPRFQAAFEEALQQALGATEVLLSQLQIATKQLVPDAGAAIERLSRHWHLSESTEQIAKAALLTEPAKVQESVYGLVNSFTSAAQSLEGEKRYDLEMLAGSLAQHGVPQFALSKREVEASPRAVERGGHQREEGPARTGTRAGTRLARTLTAVGGER